MKKFFKVLTSTLLALVMILTDLPWLPSVDLSEVDWDNFSFENIQLKLGGIAEAFAGSSSSEEFVPDRTGNATWNHYGDAALAPKLNQLDTYILEVNMLSVGSHTECDKIIIKYYASAEDKAAGIIRTQYLNPNSSTNYSVSSSAYNYDTFRQRFSGSKVGSYASLLDNQAFRTAYTANQNATSYAYGSGTSYYINGMPVVKDFADYNTWAAALTGATPGYKSASDKSKIEPFSQNYSTDYLRFQFEYGFYELNELSFYCQDDEDNSKGNVEFYIDNWILYKHDGEFDESGQLVPGATRLENYAFVSDSLGMSFNGTKLYESDIRDDDYFDCVGGGCFTFRNVDHKDTVKYDMLYSFRAASGDIDSKMSVEDRTILHFGINIADEYGAGMADGLRTGVIPEVLYADIYYYDKNGRERAIGVPVVTNALMEYAVPVDDDILEQNSYVYETGTGLTPRYTAIVNKDLVAFGQDGDTIYFTVEFPSFSKIEYVHLKYTPTRTDSLKVDSIDIYDNGGTTEFSRRDYYRDNSIDACAIDMTLQNCTKLYTTDSYSSGVEFDAYIDTRDFEFIAASDAKTTTSNPVGKYLVTITTDTASAAGTTNPIEAYLTYDTVGGETKSTSIYSLQTAINEFYGYNLCTVTTTGYKYDTTTGDVLLDKITGEKVYTTEVDDVNEYGNYYYFMRSGGTIQFLVEAKNVNKFTSITLAYETDNNTDNWQISAVKIQKLQKESVIGKRVVSKVNVNIAMPQIKGGEATANVIREYTRPITGLKDFGGISDIHSNLAEGDSRITINFTTQQSIAEDEVRNDSEYNYAMTQDIAENVTNLGEAAVNFQVKFVVAGNRNNATRTDDCGSSNQYYVQLCFKSAGGTHSTSGYVLANQQLTSDGFRSGYTEVFTIAVNEDVGDVESINIIPEDISSESDRFDKLCLTEISVIRQNKNKVNKRFVIETSLVDDGWIGQEIVDKDEKTDNTGRRDDQLIKNYAVSYSTYAVSLEVHMDFGEYTKKDESETKQFVGAVTMDVQYMSSSSNGETKNSKMGGLQLVEEIATYAKQFSSLQMYNDFNYRVSDKRYMFVENTTVRFKIDVDDISSLIKLKLYAYSYASLSTATYFPLKGVRAYVITSEVKNPVYQNPDTDMWQIDYMEDMTMIASWSGEKNVNAASNQETAAQGVEITFDDDSVVELSSLLSDESSFESLVGRVPESRNDVMNVFVYFPETNGAKAVPTPFVSDEIKNGTTTTVSYTNAKNGYTNKVYIKASEMDMKQGETYIDGKKYNVMYKLGVSASNMVQVTNLNLSSSKILSLTNKNDFVVSHAVVQQVRSGTVISTYRINLNNYYGLDTSGSSLLGMNDAEQLGFEQQVTFQLGPESMEAELLDEIYDIGVSIVYTTTIDGGEYEYESPFVFATDSMTSEGSRTVHPGSVLNFTFNEGFVDRVKAVKVVGLNGIEVETGGMQIRTYQKKQTDAGTYSDSYLKNAFCINTGNMIQINKSIQQLDITSEGQEDDHVLRRVDITFNMMEDTEAKAIDSAGSAPIRMTLSYQQDDDLETLEIADVRSYVSTDDCFTPGSSTTLTFFAEGITALNDMTIEPYDSNAGSIASMNIKSVTYKVEDVTDTALHESSVNTTVYEGSPLNIDLSGLSVKAVATYKALDGEETTAESINEEKEITVGDNVTITFAPQLGADDTYGVTYIQYAVENGVEREVKRWAVSAGETEQITTLNQSSAVKTIIIEIVSSKSPTVKTRFKINVMPQDQTSTTGNN